MSEATESPIPDLSLDRLPVLRPKPSPEPASEPPSGPAPEPPRPPSPVGRTWNLWTSALRRMQSNRLALFCLALVASLFAFSFLGPPMLSWFWGLDAFAQDVMLGATSPSMAHPFGTDILGRDMLARVMLGGRLSLSVGLVATAVSITIGVFYGAAAGYVGGRIDNLMMRVVDVLYAMPYMFLVIILMVFVRAIRSEPSLPPWTGPILHPTVVLFFALGAIQWLTMARIVRGQVLSLKRREFVAAARTIGVSGPGILWRHLVPNTLGPVVVYTTLTVPSVILQEAFLSFLGLGVEAPDASWGSLVESGKDAMVTYPWLLAFPATFLAATIFSLNAVGDGLRDALDPQMRRK